MRLEDYYYRFLGCETDGGNRFVCRLQLLPDCDVYTGHFPGKPVCPGVFNLQMVKECVQRVAGHRLRMVFIKLCRLTAVATPTDCPLLTLDIRLSASYQVEAKLSSDGKSLMTVQCMMTEVERT